MNDIKNKKISTFLAILLTLLIINMVSFTGEAQPEWTSDVMLPSPPVSGQCAIWADEYTVPLNGWTYIYFWWKDVGCCEYYIVIYETYPDGTTRRYPPYGYYGPYSAPGPSRALRGKFIGDVAGKHCLYFQVYCYDYLVCTSNSICIDVVKEKKPSTITVSVSPPTIERGGSVKISGFISPGVSARVTLKMVAPDGQEIVRETFSTATGHFSYTFSPDKVGEWRVQAVWAGNDDYVGASSDWASFRVETRKYTVSISTVPAGLPIVVDGREYRGAAMFQWDEGSYHTLFVQQAIPAGEGKRYVFKQWSDGSKAASRTVTVAGPATYQAIFEAQYLVSVETEYGDVSGVGWYTEGEQARVKLETPVVQLGEDTRVIFAGWSGDARGADPELWLRVNKQYLIKANWKKQYRVTVITELSSARIEGGEWQDEGASIKVYVEKPRLGFIVEDAFRGFRVVSGKCEVVFSDSSLGVSVVKVNGPCTLRAVWEKDYTKLIVAIAIIIAAGVGYMKFSKKIRELAKKKK